MGERDSTSDSDMSVSLSLFIVSAAACTRGEGSGEVRGEGGREEGREEGRGEMWDDTGEALGERLGDNSDTLSSPSQLTTPIATPCSSSPLESDVESRSDILTSDPACPCEAALSMSSMNSDPMEPCAVALLWKVRSSGREKAVREGGPFMEEVVERGGEVGSEREVNEWCLLYLPLSGQFRAGERGRGRERKGNVWD